MFDFNFDLFLDCGLYVSAHDARLRTGLSHEFDGQLHDLLSYMSYFWSRQFSSFFVLRFFGLVEFCNFPFLCLLIRSFIYVSNSILFHCTFSF